MSLSADARIEAIRSGLLPRHIALLADDLGSNGHGEPIFELLFEALAIPHLSLSFASEEEAARFLGQQLEALARFEVAVEFFGLRKPRRPEHQALFAKVATATRNFGRSRLWVATASDGRSEILCAVKNYVLQKASAALNGRPLDEETFRSFLPSAKLPDPDLIIITGGKRRIHNALLWQMAYAELWVAERPWADIGSNDLLDAVEAFQQRQRRFGGLVQTP